jgi:hypothetical protein
VAGGLRVLWPISYSEYHPEKIWPMCTSDIALSSDDYRVTVNSERYSYIVFDKCYCTKNRGACVEAIIWLMGILIRHINLNDGTYIIS